MHRYFLENHKLEKKGCFRTLKKGREILKHKVCFEKGGFIYACTNRRRPLKGYLYTAKYIPNRYATAKRTLNHIPTEYLVKIALRLQIALFKKPK